MLKEGVEIMRAMWTEDVVDYDGRYYRLDGAISQPKPLQDPHIPLWIAGGGEQVTLNIAARYAQYTNFGGDDLDAFLRKSEILQGHCADVGTDFDAITRSADFNILCATTETEVEEKIQWLVSHVGRYVSQDRAERFGRAYRITSGTPEQVVAKLGEFGEAGLDYAIVNFADVAYDRESLELFAKEVIPALS
jgi:alkanesulfonate monooxygenase SsuD/methylene tetrahydromethanopterin reductase-like flavin-dependent oxidoreductase (luciferase family)